MRFFLKFLHTMGAIGLMGAMSALIILASLSPEPAAIETYAMYREIMGKIAQWLLLPSLAIVLLSGLWSMAFTSAYANAGWAWLKLATGILVFKGVLLSIQGPVVKEAELSAQALAGDLDLTALGQRLTEEWIVLWVMMVVAVANVVLGIWRPKLMRKTKTVTAKPIISAAGGSTDDRQMVAQQELK